MDQKKFADLSEHSRDKFVNYFVTDIESQKNEINSVDGDNELCRICLNELIQNEGLCYVRGCHHVFHKECIIEFIYRDKIECAICDKCIF